MKAKKRQGPYQPIIHEWIPIQTVYVAKIGEPFPVRWLDSIKQGLLQPNLIRADLYGGSVLQKRMPGMRYWKRQCRRSRYITPIPRTTRQRHDTTIGAGAGDSPQ